MGAARTEFDLPSARALHAERARRTLLGFTLWTKPDYQVNWHHKLVASALDRLVRGEVKRMMIFQPPRTGKSELVSRRLPAFALGRNPREEILAAAYGDTLAQKENRDVQRIMMDEPYRELFPGTCLWGSRIRKPVIGTAVRNSSTFEVVDANGRLTGGVYRARGARAMGGGFGSTLFIIDDPIKNREEADSAAKREAVWDFYTSSVYTRRANKDTRILITLTRWHEDDLAGRLLSLAAGGGAADQWEVIRLPAIAEGAADRHPLDPRAEGEALWPERFSLDDLEAVKVNSGTREWISQYQQRPAPEGGGIFKREWFRRWSREAGSSGGILLDRGGARTRVAEASLTKFATVDLAISKDEGADYTVVALWGMTKARELLLLDLWRGRFDAPETLDVVRAVNQRHHPAFIGIESVAYQKSLVQLLRKEKLPVRELHPDKDKVSRAYVAAAQMEAEDVFFPEAASWLAEFENELLVFPNGAHDDQVDALSYAAEQAALGASQRVSIRLPGDLAGPRPFPWRE